MKTITMIGCFAFSQMMAFSKELVRMLPAGEYQLRTTAVKPEHEDIDPLITRNVTVRHDKDHVFLDIDDRSVPMRDEGHYRITFTIPPSESPRTWQVTQVYTGSPFSRDVAGKITGKAWLISHGSIGLGVEQTFSLELKGHPPGAESIREILLDAQNPAAEEDVKTTKTELSRYLTKGRFVNHLDERLAAIVKREDTDEEAGTTHFSGVFAANDGRVFKFRRQNKQVMEITGVAGSGWLIIEAE